MKKFIFGLVVFGLFSTNSFAVTACSGNVNWLGFRGDTGHVDVSLSNMNNVESICNMNSQGSYSTTTNNCSKTYATLLAAKISNKPVNLWFLRDGSDCKSKKQYAGWNDFYAVTVD